MRMAKCCGVLADELPVHQHSPLSNRGTVVLEYGVVKAADGQLLGPLTEQRLRSHDHGAADELAAQHACIASRLSSRHDYALIKALHTRASVAGRVRAVHNAKHET